MRGCMNILFLTLCSFCSIHEKGIYTDLLREFAKNNHKLYVITPVEKNKNEPTALVQENDTTILKLRIGNIKKTNLIEKGISTLTLESKLKSAIKKHFYDVKFDLVLYSTPPITFQKAIEFVKKRDNAKTYLLLKDIFPQNAVDLGIMCKTGIKGLLYKFFRNKEKKLYAVSDRIGCMSQANVDYVLRNNPEINPDIVEICPNAIEPQDLRLDEQERIAMRAKYGIPVDKKVFVYGGNLGKPQDIPFIIDCLRAEKNNDAFFLIVGEGTEYVVLEEFVNNEKSPNIKLMRHLPKDDYDRMIASCDVGMIFLDHRFTIPNFPSRLLSYMQAGLPVLACTDSNTDIGEVILNGRFGWWCESSNVDGFVKCVEDILITDESEIERMKNNGFNYLILNYSVEKVYANMQGC